MTRKRLAAHQWLKDRDTTEAWIVLRIDNYSDSPEARGQFYPDGFVSEADKPGGKAIWPSEFSAKMAAGWAAQKFGHTYGVFKLDAIIEPAKIPLKTTKV